MVICIFLKCMITLISGLHPILGHINYRDFLVLEIAQMVGHTTTQMIIQNYGKYIKGEHLKIDKGIKLFTNNSADSKIKSE